MNDPPPGLSLRERMLGALLAPRPDIATSVWLLRLRWFAVIGQLVTVSVAVFVVGVEMPAQPLLVLVGFTAATNVVYAVWLRGETAENVIQSDRESAHPELSVPSVAGVGFSAEIKTRVAVLLMMVDLVTLTIMLHFSGGVNNPFASFYFVNLAVAGVILRPRWAWMLTFLSVLAFTSLLFSYMPLEVLGAGGLESAGRTRQLGEFIAFAACATVVTYFVTRTSGELLRRERQLREAEEERARGRQLEGLSTLAAGAAHELATPMSTALLIARELQHHLEGVDLPRTVKNDLQLIDSELRHCRSILARMRSAAGDHASEQWARTTLGELVDAVLEGIREPHRVEVDEATDSIEDTLLWLPREAVAQAIRNLVHNGLDASPGDSLVHIHASIDNDRLKVTVDDAGEGMSAATLDRIGQPFFTTKEPGRGMGLGLFLSRNVIRRLGGQLSFRSEVGRGTHAVIELPIRSS